MTIEWDNSATGDGPANSGITITGVTCDFSAFGGGTAVTMYDDGTNGDVTSSDNIYTAQYALGV